MGYSGGAARAAAGSSPKAKPALTPPANPGDHASLRGCVNALHGDVAELKGQVAELKGQVKVILGIAGATFLGVFGLMLATVFS